MLINGKRALAYTAIIHDIKDIPGADNIQLGYVNAWSIIIKKNEFDILFDDEELNRINWKDNAFDEKNIFEILKNLLTIA